MRDNKRVRTGEYLVLFYVDERGLALIDICSAECCAVERDVHRSRRRRASHRQAQILRQISPERRAVECNRRARVLSGKRRVQILPVAVRRDTCLGRCRGKLFDAVAFNSDLHKIGAARTASHRLANFVVAERPVPERNLVERAFKGLVKHVRIVHAVGEGSGVGIFG